MRHQAGRVERVAPGLYQLVHYRRGDAGRDGLAALTVWAIVVPQALAYALTSRFSWAQRDSNPRLRPCKGRALAI